MPVSDPKGYRCPLCTSRDLAKSVAVVSMDITINNPEIPAFRCKKCLLDFTVWG